MRQKKSPSAKDFKISTSREVYETTRILKYSIVFLYFLRLASRFKGNQSKKGMDMTDQNTHRLDNTEIDRIAAVMNDRLKLLTFKSRNLDKASTIKRINSEVCEISVLLGKLDAQKQVGL